MTLPSQLGQPCWDADQVGKVISITAQTHRAGVDYFLAAHSPFRFISNFRNLGVEISEEQAFQEIFGANREVLAAVKGEPGTGKSHLVHWMNLRADFATESGENGFAGVRRVLVQRGNGSLKDALRQIVEQLGPDFKDQLRRVQGAIEKLSVETARATLLSKLALEIDYHWNERGRKPLPNNLRYLGTALKSGGIGRWLLRDGGTVDRVVRRLTEASTVDERETFPSFESEELTPPPTFRSLHENSRQVIDFFEDMEMESEIRDEAVRTLNTAMRDAVSELVGLNRATLQEVFLEIRRRIGKGKTLALFIEDVSVTGLDREVINALEPQRRDDLCRLVAVIGMTSNAWGLLEQAQMQRISPVFEIGAEMTRRWSGDPEEVAKFTARYLNAIRLSDREVRSLASARFDTKDVSLSKCSDCPVRPECHEIFGAVSFGDGIEVGMFPFTKRAPQALLSNLRESGDTTGVARSQRGLLENVLRPVLQDSRVALEEQAFPKPEAIPLQPVALSDWERLVNGWLGGGAWDETNRRRLRMLAEFWTTAGSAEEMAAQLHPLLKPFGLPSIPKVAQKSAHKTTPKESGKEQLKPLLREPDSQLAPLLTHLENWSRGEKLQRDTVFRDLLSGLITRSIRWEDERDVPYHEFNAYIKGTAFPRIQDQTANPANQPYFLDLERNDESRSLLSALVQFRYAGGSSWNFSGGELHKRTISRWLRKHRTEAVAATMPAPPLDRLDAVRVASELLVLAAMIRDRKRLPEDPAECLSAILAAISNERSAPITFSSELRELVSDLEKRHEGLREIILREVGAGQGRVDPKDFLDPRVSLAAAESLRQELGIQSLPQEFNERRWQKRFYGVTTTTIYQELSSRLDAERQQIARKVEEVLAVVRKSGCEQDDAASALHDWLGQFVEVIEVQRGKRGRQGVLPHPSPAFDELWERNVFRTRGDVWGTAIRRAREVANGSPGDVLNFEPSGLKELSEAVGIADRHLETVECVLSGIEEGLDKKGGASCEALLGELLAFPFSERADTSSETSEESPTV